MTIATLMATCAMFLVTGWTGGAYAALAITVGGVVAIAGANAWSDFAGFEDGISGSACDAAAAANRVDCSCVGGCCSLIGLTLIGMNKGPEKYTPNVIPIDLAQLPDGVQVESQNYEHAGKRCARQRAGLGLPDGKYLYDSAALKQIEIQWVQGIGSEAAPAPQARSTATVINGILTRRLPWRLVLGVFLVSSPSQLLGVPFSLSFARRLYLSIATTAAIFAGARCAGSSSATSPRTQTESEVSHGALYSSGSTAPRGGVVGPPAIKLMEIRGWVTPINSTSAWWIGGLATSDGWAWRRSRCSRHLCLCLRARSWSSPSRTGFSPSGFCVDPAETRARCPSLTLKADATKNPHDAKLFLRSRDRLPPMSENQPTGREILEGAAAALLLKGTLKGRRLDSSILFSERHRDGSAGFARKLSAREALADHLKQIERVNPKVNAIVWCRK